MGYNIFHLQIKFFWWSFKHTYALQLWSFWAFSSLILSLVTGVLKADLRSWTGLQQWRRDCSHSRNPFFHLCCNSSHTILPVCGQSQNQEEVGCPLVCCDLKITETFQKFYREEQKNLCFDNRQGCVFRLAKATSFLCPII